MERDEQNRERMQRERREMRGDYYGGSEGDRIGTPGYADHWHSSGGTQSSLGGSRRFDQHGGQSGNQWQGHDIGGSGQSGSAHSPGGGFDQQRYGQQGLGSWGGGLHHDDHAYRNWRDQQMRRFDQDYEEFRRHRQERFGAEFEEWRRSRGGQGSAAASHDLGHASSGMSFQGSGERVSTTQWPIDNSMSDKSDDMK